jgi:2-iminobutanoate/2-iminopropanoate deaminase
MNKRIHTIENAPKPVGPYSVAVSFDRLLFLSGQIPIDPSTNQIISGGFEAEVRQSLENLKNCLEGSGASLDSVLKVTVFLLDMGNFSVFNQIYGEYFTQNPPARSAVQVGALPKGAKIEVEAIAYRKEA